MWVCQFSSLPYIKALAQDFPALFQLLDFFFELRSPALHHNILSSHFFELFSSHLHDKGRRENSQWRIRTCDQKMIRDLHAHAVHKSLPSEFVIRLEYVMNLLYHMIGVAKWVILSDVVKSHHRPMFAIGERLVCQIGAKAVLAAIPTNE
jgi:hypothetical protein